MKHNFNPIKDNIFHLNPKTQQKQYSLKKYISIPSKLINKKIIFMFLFSLLLLNNQINCIIVIPFKSYSIETLKNVENYNSTNLVNDFYINDFYTNLEIGTPAQKVLSLILPKNHLFVFSENYLNRKSLSEFPELTKKNYEFVKSTSFKNISHFYYTYGENKEASLCSDKFTFYNSVLLNSTVTLPEIKFLIDYERDDSVSTLVGLNVPLTKTYLGPPNLIDSLSEVKSINQQAWVMRFLNDTDGIFILGDEPHDYEKNNPRYSKLNYQKVESLSAGDFYNPFSLNLTKIYDKKFNTTNKQAYLDYSSSFIIGTQQYGENITKNYFKKLFENGICKNDTVEFNNGVSTRFYNFNCDKKKFMQDKENYYANFPTLYLESSDLSYTFELKNKDLFKEVNNIIYFMILFEFNIYPHPEEESWVLGLPFLKKYEFVNNYDDKTIGFYFPLTEDEINGDSFFNLKNVILVLIVIILVIAAFFVGKKCRNDRKKRANELKEEDYDYLENKKDEKKNADEGLGDV